MYAGRVVYQAMGPRKDARKQAAALSMSNKVICKPSDGAAEMHEALAGMSRRCEMNLHDGANAMWAEFYCKQPICCSLLPNKR